VPEAPLGRVDAAMLLRIASVLGGTNTYECVRPSLSHLQASTVLENVVFVAFRTRSGVVSSGC
jgi:hypothetical protein